MGRIKGLPAFDAFGLSAAENIPFGDKTVDARHFTVWNAQQAGGDPSTLPGRADAEDDQRGVVADKKGQASGKKGGFPEAIP